MDKCPVCGSELNSPAQKYRHDPDGNILIGATIYDCPNDGIFVLRLGSAEALSKDSMAVERVKQHLRPIDGALRVIDVYHDNSGKEHVICINHGNQ